MLVSDTVLQSKMTTEGESLKINIFQLNVCVANLQYQYYYGTYLCMIFKET